MGTRKYRYFVGDFETTVYKGQTHTEVWASASVELFTEDVKIFHSIQEQFDYFVSLNSNIICYYHNLKFDGSFWTSFLLLDLGYKQAYAQTGETVADIYWLPPKDMKNKSFQYSISNMGQWYRMIIKVNDRIIEFRDSLKLLPFTVKQIGLSFQTKHKKLDMEYKGFRYAGCEITDEEKEYIANDVLVIKEAIEIMFTDNHKRLTIGSCCLAEYRKLLGHTRYTEYFPNIYEIEIDLDKFGSPNAGEYVRKSYKGGWCYLARDKSNKIYHNGTTADVNSLYPSMMSSQSGNPYPIGKPTFWKGNFIPDEALSPTNYYFIRIKTRFYIKENKLPFIQIKNNIFYKSTEMLETSDLKSSIDGCYYDSYIDFEGNTQPAIVILTMTMTDFRLFLEHYETVDFEILDGCYFKARVGIFDEYIDKYKKIKIESKGAKRQLAKLFLNNLYGKMASSTNSSFKVAYEKEDLSIGYFTCEAHDKQPGYIPVGSAITSYARNFTIRAAQANYYGKDKPGFIYADTDSIHCDLKPEEIRGINIHPTDFCCWKLEAEWDEGIFVRQKTYIEHIVKEDGETIAHPEYSVKCAGMPDKCKRLLVNSFEGYTPQEGDEYTDEEIEFMKTKREITDFKVGLTVPGKLLPKRIHGGVVLVDTPYEMRNI